MNTERKHFNKYGCVMIVEVAFNFLQLFSFQDLIACSLLANIEDFEFQPLIMQCHIYKVLLLV